MTTHTPVPRWFGGRALRPVLGADWEGLDRLFDELWREAPRADFAPRIDVDETDEELRVSAELPGLEEKDFEVRLDGDVLSIRGERRDEREQKREGYRHWETARGSFRRAIRLPFEVDADAVKAIYRNGVLTVTLPKPEEARPAVRTIPVAAAS